MRQPTFQGVTSAPEALAETPAVPTLGIAHFAMIGTANEILVTVGQSRVAIQVKPDGAPEPVQLIEWMQALSIPPPVAVLLRDGLSDVLDHYAKTFGQIPIDPGTKVTTAKGVPPRA